MKVYVVNKNADFTEGRGPMCLHKVFETYKDAFDYIQDQQGIFGSKQYIEPYEFSNKSMKPTTSWSFNGYDIQEKEVDTYDKVKQAEQKRLTKNGLLAAAQAKFKEGTLDKATLDALKAVLEAAVLEAAVLEA